MRCPLLFGIVIMTWMWGSSEARGLLSDNGGYVQAKDGDWEDSHRLRDVHLSRDDEGDVQPKDEAASTISRDPNSSSTSDDDSSATKGSDCTCGKRNTATRIVGGVMTEQHEYPWQVALTSKWGNHPFCGGSIISDEWILTAAHCVNSYTPKYVAVVVGEHNWRTPEETSVTKKLAISQVIRHEKYTRRTLNNDIALLKLAEPIVFPNDNKIAKVCLPASGTYDNVQATITGWGTLSSGGSQPDQLNEVTVPTMSNAQCRATGYRASSITDNMICAGVNEGGKDSCQGDSGGPMVTPGQAGYMQIGVVSWGIGCASARYPGVYARVTEYVAWIKAKTSGSSVCQPVA